MSLVFFAFTMTMVCMGGFNDAPEPVSVVKVDLNSVNAPWMLPASEYSPNYGQFVEELECGPESGDGWKGVGLRVTVKRHAPIPLGKGIAWSGEAPLGEIRVPVRNLGTADAEVFVSLLLEGGKHVLSPSLTIGAGREETLRFELIDAEPPQLPGARAKITAIGLSLQNPQPHVSYHVIFGELTFCQLPAYTPLAILPINAEGRAGEPVTLSWQPVETDLPTAEGETPVRIVRGENTFLDTTTTLSIKDGKAALRTVQLSTPKGMPAGAYEVQIDTGRILIAGRPPHKAMVGGIVLAEAPPPPTIRATVERHNGVPTVHIEGKPVTALTYMTYNLNEDYVKQFRDAGIDFISFSAVVGQHPYGLAATSWPKPDVYDFTQCDARITRILSANPQAKILIRVYIDCPAWWAEAHPDECVMAMERDGTVKPLREPGGHRPGSWASEKWRADMGDALARFVRYLRAAAYADHVIGLMLCSGTTEEWMLPGSNSNTATDYSPPAVRGFRFWLKERYGDNQTLRQAWGDPAADFETVSPPSAIEREAWGRGNFLRHPDQTNVADWWRYLSRMTADAIEHFARIVKTESNNEWLCGTFYGYVIQFDEARVRTAGHLAIDQVARSPFLDFISSPTLYSDRTLEPGGYSVFMSLTDTYALHGKLWWDENDLRTFRAGDAAYFEALEQLGARNTAEETINMLHRELGNVLAHGCSQWYFDMKGGWYDDPRLIETVRAESAAAQKALAMDRASVSEICVVVDPDAFTEQCLYTATNRSAVLGQTASLGAMGAPFEFVSLSDMEQLPPRKLWVFLNLHIASADVIQRVHSRLERDHATGLFIYASGFQNGEDVMRELTGMTIRAGWQKRGVTVDVSGQALGLGQGAVMSYGTSSTIGALKGDAVQLLPTFAVEDGEARVLGRDSQTGAPALCEKDMGGWTSIYSAAPGLSAEVLRALARRAGVHIYSDENAVVYANASVLSVTVAAPGAYTLSLPAPCTVRDVFTGEVLAETATTFQTRFDEHESRLFSIDRK